MLRKVSNFYILNNVSSFIKGACIFLFILLINASSAFAIINSDINKKPLPRFASVKFEEVNVRFGPGKNYPIKYLLKRKNMPVKIVKEFDNWYLIEMVDASDAWIHKSQLSGNRYGFVNIGGYAKLYESREDETIVAKVGNGNVIKIDKCSIDSAFCEISIKGVSGYLKKQDFFGLLDGEKVN
ncbi:MAG: SH3 domain-containing protein [Alphaproteobacteria bacterium]|jgi:SH3-like domain-containing protein|nr:SH3 domain-containing protein [Alphaproteobacteria bacterium]